MRSIVAAEDQNSWQKTIQQYVFNINVLCTLTSTWNSSFILVNDVIINSDDRHIRSCNLPNLTGSDRIWPYLLDLTHWSYFQKVIHRDVCKSRIHDRRDYRDFRQLSWFYVTAVIITKYVQFRLPNGQFCLNICSAFSLSWARIVASLSLLHCRDRVRAYTERWPHTRLHRVRQIRPVSSLVTTSIPPIAREKASTAWVGVSYENTDTVDAWVGSEVNDRGVAL